MKQSVCIYWIVGGILLFCSCKESVRERIIRPVKTMEVGGNTITGKIFPGYAEAEEYAYLTFHVGGMLQQFNVEEGQNLKAGQLIGSLDPREYNLKVSATKARFLQSQSQLERYQRLYEKNAVSKQEYEMTMAEYESNKSAYNQALSDLKDTRLLAPFSGNIEKKYVENHQEVRAGERIVKLNNPAKIQFRFILPEINTSLDREKLKCSVELDVNKGVFYQAVVKEIVSSSVEGSGIPVIVRIDDPAYNAQSIKVLPGYSCNVRVEWDDSHERGGISIPLSCIYLDPQTKKTAVWKVDPGTSTVHLIPVETGNMTGEKDILILSGLQKGDVIVTAGVTMLSEGEHVKINGL